LPLTDGPASNQRVALNLKGVTRRFGSFVAVDNLNMSVKTGERRAILGSNGAGKTTLFNLITGDFPLSEGSIEIEGVDSSSLPTHKRIQAGLRRTYQHALLFDSLSVRDTLLLAVVGINNKWHLIYPLKKNSKYHERAEALAKVAGLSSKMDVLVGALSHGQKRQLEIGIALSGDPKIVLFDEPAAGLSPAERPVLTELLLSLPKELSVVLIEHDMDIALETSTIVSVMHNGKHLLEGEPEEVVHSDIVREIYVGKRQ